VTGAAFGEVDIDLLADYIGGALAGTPTESAVAARIADDPAWQTAYDSLSASMAFVGAELSRLDTEPMPADLAARLDTMFRSADGATTASESPPALALVRGNVAVDDGSTPVPKKIAKRAGRRLRFATPIAIAAGVVAFIGFGMDYVAGRNAERTSDSAAPAAARPESAGDSTRSAPLAGPKVLASGTDYTLGTLARETAVPLTAPGSEPSSTRTSSPELMTTAEEPELQRLAAMPALQDCLNEIERENVGGTISVQSVDYARFDGLPAVVVRFTAANGRVAWASGPSCGAPGAGADTLGKVPVR
jgi:hypothetical protein